MLPAPGETSHQRTQRAPGSSRRVVARAVILLIVITSAPLIGNTLKGVIYPHNMTASSEQPAPATFVPRDDVVQELESREHNATIIDEDATNELGHTFDPELAQFLEKVMRDQSDQLHIYAANLDTKRYAEHQSRQAIPSGSIYKLFLAEHVFRQVASHELSLERTVPGQGHTLAECTRLMVQHSSNACGKAVRKMLGAETTTRALHERGYESTNLLTDPASETSARDVAWLLTRVHESEGLGDEHTQLLQQYLRNQQYTFRIPEGLPREPAIAGEIGTRNKTGDVFGYTNDAAIIYGENTDYVLVILSGEWQSPTASSLVHRRISGQMYNYFNQTEYELPYE